MLKVLAPDAANLGPGILPCVLLQLLADGVGTSDMPKSAGGEYYTSYSFRRRMNNACVGAPAWAHR